MSLIRYWNALAQRLVADDHTGTPPPANRGGPVQTSYALALLHLALHDTVAKTGGDFAAFHDLPAAAPTGIAQDEALTGAFVEMALHLYPSHFSAILAARDVARATLGTAIPSSAEAYGESVANALIALRQDDGSVYLDDYSYGVEKTNHRPDPAQAGQTPLGSKWGDVKPFTYTQGAHPPMAAPPAITSAGYLRDYREVVTEGREDLWRRKPLQAMIGTFWGYDGSQKLGTPPRLYNQIVRTISDPLNLSLVDEVRLLTLVNVGMADAGIACWHYKYHFNLWRPVVHIREAGDGAGPKAEGDGLAATKGDPFWLPLGLPATNGPRFGHYTPGFPAYPSGHSTFGATCFLLTARFFETHAKNVKFEFVSDEFNGVNRDGNGVIRPRLKRPFSLQSALEENAESRVWLGVHWRFDATEGIKLAEGLIDGVDTKFGKPRGPKLTAARASKRAPQPVPPMPGRREQMR